MTAETHPVKPKRDVDLDQIKPAPDAWERFEKAMDKVVKAPPQHRTARRGKDKDP